MAIPITLSELNQFTVLAARAEGDRTLLTGRLTRPGDTHRGQDIRLFVGLTQDVPGRLTAVDPDAATGVMNVFTKHVLPAVVPGASFPVYDDYWFGRLHHALGPAGRWARKAFAAPDSFVEIDEATGVRKWRQAVPGDAARADGEVVPGGWDHEHCDICWRHVGLGGDLEGYVNGHDFWLCVDCHDRYVATGDLRFVIEGVEGGQDDDERPDAVREAARRIDDLIGRYDLPALRAYAEGGGDVDVQSRYGWTPLMVGSSRGHQSLVRLLLSAGADADAVAEGHGVTPLALAAQGGQFEVVEILLAAGASVAVAAGACGGSLLGYVRTGSGRNDPRIAERLTRAGAV